MIPFLTRFAALVRGVLSGFDRLFLTGSFRARARTARRLGRAGLNGLRRDNPCPVVEGGAAAQALFDQQLPARRPTLLGEWAAALTRVHDELCGRCRFNSYWWGLDSEWASGV